MTLLSSVLEPWFRQRIIDEANRVLGPDGRLVIYDIRYPSPGNPNVRPVSVSELEGALPGWTLSARSLTLLPPLARRVRSPIVYRLMAAVPVLRSHIGVVATRPA